MTTVVGAHSVPRWYEALDLLVALGQLAPGDFVDAQLRATQAVILEQEIARHRCHHGGRDASPDPQPSCASQRDAQSFLAKDSLVLAMRRRDHRTEKFAPPHLFNPRHS